MPEKSQGQRSLAGYITVHGVASQTQFSNYTTTTRGDGIISGDFFKNMVQYARRYLIHFKNKNRFGVFKIEVYLIDRIISCIHSD